MNLKSLCHLDGRNLAKVESLREYFSEYGIIKYRLLVEIKYLQALAKQLKNRSYKEYKKLDKLVSNFNESEAQKIRSIEKKINHDVKAIEYYLKKYAKTELVHFAVTSEDINNIAFCLLTKDALNKEFIPKLEEVVKAISLYANKYKKIPMLARTHGQPASPTSVGKEFKVFLSRLKEEIKILESYKLAGKLSGASGNYNSFVLASPSINWQKFSKNFVKDLSLDWADTTTQIAPYEPYIRIFDSIKRINYILLDMVVDLWQYVCLGYFQQKNIKGEVGSSAMPHKINPINLEAAEGNLGFANSMFEYFARKLPLNRMQRDLSDSTIRRNFGLAFAYSYFAYDSILNGVSRLKPNIKVIKADLESHYEVLMEAVQTYLRLHGYKKSYEKLKKLSRGRVINKSTYQRIIKNLKLKSKDKVKLLSLSPKQYIGYSNRFKI